jgi:1-acyl-sn-glycerol-3-phosphate acyltransferase
MHAAMSAPNPSPPWWKVALATFTGTLYIVFGTLLLSSLAFVVAIVPPRGHWTFRVGRFWSRWLLRSSWVRLEVEGLDGLDPAGRYVFLANHQSLFDIPALFASVPGQTRFLAKRSLFRIPIFGWAIAAGGFIPVDRGDRSTARDSFEQAVRRLGAGVSIMIFPEETRSLDGRVLPLRRGGFLIALKSGLPVVPVGLEGTLAVQRRTSFLIRPGVVRVRYGRPGAAAEHSVKQLRGWMAETRQEIARLAGAGLAADDPPRASAGTES